MEEINKIITVKKGNRDYPESLSTLEDAPETLYCIGNISLMKKTCIAVVGSRKCTEYGKQTAMNIGKTAAQNGIVTVSGMAKGIDSFAHIGALRNGGETIAVLGCGPDVCYPASNRSLYENIKEKGLIVSEIEPGKAPMPYMFPRRNRIVSGLSQAVVVAEAGTGSGALITAELAASQGREVFSVPGNISSFCSLGSNKLLMDGARPIAVIDDIFTELGIPLKSTPEEMETLGRDEAMVFEIVKANGETTVDFLCRKLQKDAFYINGIVGVLEIKGLVTYSFGRIFVAKF